MPFSVQWQNQGAIADRLAAVQAAARPSSPEVRAYRADIAAIVAEDHVAKMLRGVDRYGRPRAGLARATLLDPRRGSGPSLIPLGEASRFLLAFRQEWSLEGEAWVLHAGFDAILSRQGRNIVPFHLAGASRPGTKWVLPARDVGGVTPAGIARVRARHQQLPLDILGRAGRFGTYRG